MTAHRSFGGRLVRRRSAILILLALVGSVSSAGPVVAANGTTLVRGVQSAYGTCRDVEGVLGYQMTGSLEGCWVIDTFVSATDPNRSTFRAIGTEHFEGCLGSVCGTFQTTYSYTAKTDGPWPTSAEVHGRCHHPVVGGAGGFAGARGEISFHDVVDVSPPYYPYIGNVHLART